MPQIGSLVAIAVAVVLSCGGSAVRAEPLPIVKDLRGRGLDVGGGLSVHLDNVDAPPNASILERHALRFDYNGVGVRFRMDGEDDAFKVGLYYGEGRNEKKKEISEFLIPALLGYKTSALIVMSLFGVGVMVVKSLIVAKLAAVIAAAIWAKKYLGGDGGGYHHDIGGHASELHPVYAEYPGDISELGYAQTASGNYIAYAAPQQDVTGNLEDAGAAVAASNQHYSFAEAPSSGGQPANVTQRRRESVISRPQAIHTYITVKRKTVSHSRAMQSDST